MNDVSCDVKYAEQMQSLSRDIAFLKQYHPDDELVHELEDFQTALGVAWMHSALRRGCNDRAPAGQSSSSSTSFEYEVEAIVRRRRLKGSDTWEYEVKWKGFDVCDNTWEPLENLSGAHALLLAFYERNNLPLPHDLEQAIRQRTN